MADGADLAALLAKLCDRLDEVADVSPLLAAGVIVRG